MKLFKLAAILLACSGVALAQVDKMSSQDKMSSERGMVTFSGPTSSMRIANPDELLAFGGRIMKVSEYMELMWPHAQIAAMMQAQSALQCTSFPCQLSITAAQCPSGLPCAITITNGPKFTIGDRVAVTHAGPTVAVRLAAASNGGLLGVQPNGRTGLVIGGPVIDTTGDHKTRWQIDYAAGVDGWSVEDYLERTNQPPPVCNPPSTVINGVCTPPAPSVSMTLTPAMLTFGSPAVGAETAIQVFTLTNTGTANLVITAETGLKDNLSTNSGLLYGGIGTCDDKIPIPAGKSCTISAKYRAAALGVVTGTLVVTTNASNSPLSVNMTAGSVPPPGKSVRLDWNPPAGTVCSTSNPPVCVPAASYNLYRGGVKVGNVVGSVLTFTDTPVPSGTYVYTARTVDSAGLESVDSNQAMVTIP